MCSQNNLVGHCACFHPRPLPVITTSWAKTRIERLSTSQLVPASRKSLCNSLRSCNAPSSDVKPAHPNDPRADGRKCRRHGTTSPEQSSLDSYSDSTDTDIHIMRFLRYYIQKKGRTGFGAGMIVFYFVIFFIMISAYLRTFAATDETNEKQPLPPPPPRRRRRRRGEEPDVEAQPWAPVDMNPDSPGLENFYSKDVFVCEADGRPKWCSGCRQWKPDRAHHSSEIGRCVRKMDHLCPWVGGMVSETSFNFFAHSLGERKDPDGWVVAGVVLSAFFVLFSGGMALTSLRYILTNMTNIDMFSRTRISYLAVNIPLESPPSSYYPTIVYPLEQPSLLPPAAAAAATPGSVPTRPADGRDTQAQRKFAILRVESRENPWDLGPARNWTSVMGHSPLEWLLPIKHSPCCDHDGMESDYPTGPLLDELKKRFNFPGHENVATDAAQPKEHVAA
ncbi:hypothetical protein NLG97_g10747 [Lecanicillium saksenae]|uniref:Uncharacterized protein n=1 Tax=Lecanicillium saksenae TaxID=468837 RepID=A0ACC1QCB4_9HYPO|nr:hypothetical protein NLG97_g10747 [Lecanicillium saksenae]